MRAQWSSKARIRKHQWLGCAMKSPDQEVIGGEENGIEIKNWDCCTVVTSAAGPWVTCVQAKISVGHVKELPPEGSLGVRWLGVPLPAGLCTPGASCGAEPGSCLPFGFKKPKDGNPAVLLANRWCSPADFLS